MKIGYVREIIFIREIVLSQFFSQIIFFCTENSKDLTKYQIFENNFQITFYYNALVFV